MSNNIDFVIENGVLKEYHLSELQIPEGVTEIEEDAFMLCTALTSISIPNSVTEIGRLAFCGCTGLASINIPDSVTEIGERAFEGCPNLTIHAPSGSYAEQYARENVIKFEEEK